MAGPVGVVVVTYSPGETLDAFLDTLAGATSAPVQVVLADNGSTDGAPERAAARPGVTLLPTGGNLGYGRAANLGVARTGGDWVVVANPDLRWHPGALDTLLAAAERHPRAGALGPVIRSEDGTLYPSARALPSLGAGHRPRAARAGGGRRTRGRRRTAASAATRWRARPAGCRARACCCAARPSTPSAGSTRATSCTSRTSTSASGSARAGWENVYVPAAEITHLGGASTGRHAAAMADAHHASAWRYLSRRYAGARHAPLRLVLSVGLALRAALARRVPSVAAGAKPARRRR